MSRSTQTSFRWASAAELPRPLLECTQATGGHHVCFLECSRDFVACSGLNIYVDVHLNFVLRFLAFAGNSIRRSRLDHGGTRRSTARAKRIASLSNIHLDSARCIA